MDGPALSGLWLRGRVGSPSSRLSMLPGVLTGGSGHWGALIGWVQIISMSCPSQRCCMGRAPGPPGPQRACGELAEASGLGSAPGSVEQGARRGVRARLGHTSTTVPRNWGRSRTPLHGGIPSQSPDGSTNSNPHPHPRPDPRHRAWGAAA